MARTLPDVVVGAAAGLIGTQTLARVSTLLYDRTSAEHLQLEQAIESRDPLAVLVQKLEDLLGLGLDAKQEAQLAKVLDYALSVTMASLYVAAARRSRLGWLTGGLLFGTLFWAVWDEGLGPALGLVGDNRRYPLEAHLRGLASHAAFGVAAALVARTAGVTRRTL